MHYCDLWLMEPGALRQMHAIASAVTPEAMEAARQGGSAPRRERAVAVLPIHGALEARSSFVGQLFGFASMESIGNTFDQLVADDTVSAIVLDIASPGGMVYGTPELAGKVYSARGSKPIIAVANPMAASGAYWIASAADRFIATPSADVGSVGVIFSRFDATAAMEKQGVKEHVIRSSGSPYKGETTEAEPMTDEARQNFQRRADMIYETFTGDLAKFRGVSQQVVKETFGKGRLVDAKAAMQAGMIDRIGTLQETVYKLAANRIRIAKESAQDDWDYSPRNELLRRAELVKAN